MQTIELALLKGASCSRLPRSVGARIPLQYVKLDQRNNLERMVLTYEPGICITEAGFFQRVLRLEPSIELNYVSDI